jgi:hypothetical protein
MGALGTDEHGTVFVGEFGTALGTLGQTAHIGPLTGIEKKKAARRPRSNKGAKKGTKKQRYQGKRLA